MADDFRELQPTKTPPYRRNQGSHETTVRSFDVKDQTPAHLRPGVICNVKPRRIETQQYDYTTAEKVEENKLPETLADRIVSWLLENPGIHTAQEIAAAVNAGYEYVHRLSKNKNILRRKHGGRPQQPLVYWHKEHDDRANKMMCEEGEDGLNPEAVIE